MKTVKKIEVTRPVLPTRKKVAAYARVSMETDRMMHSISTQVSYYSELIQSNPEWEYADVYADNFISGTAIDRRPEFKRLLKTARPGRSTSFSPSPSADLPETRWTCWKPSGT